MKPIANATMVRPSAVLPSPLGLLQQQAFGYVSRSGLRDLDKGKHLATSSNRLQ